MSHLLTNTPRIRKSTATDKMTAILDAIESDFMVGNAKERKMIDNLGRGRKIIDISSATSMNLFHDTTEKKLATVVKKEMPRLLEKFHSYPYLIQRDFGLEKAFVAFIRRWIGARIMLDEVAISPSGVYGSYKTILLSRPGKYILAPELIHQISKACFASMGKKVIEILAVLETGLLDLAALDQQLKRHAKNIACVYIYHTKPVKPATRSYYLKLARLLKKYDVLGVIDIDSWYTGYGLDSKPWLPVTIPLLRMHCLFLFTMTKEIGAPGLRIGFIVGQQDIINSLKRFQQISLEMSSPVTRFLAELTLPRIHMDTAKKTLQSRMKTLTDGLRSLGFRVQIPPSGVNFFLHVPESFAVSKHVLPDHLFTYYVLKEAKVLLRPGSNHGHRLNHWVRFVLGQPEKNIHDALNRFQNAGIRGGMALPKGLEKEYQKVISSL